MVILVRYGEIFLKGKNRPYFEKVLRDAIANSVAKLGGRCKKGDGRYYVTGVADEQINDAVDAIGHVFGVHSISVSEEVEKDKIYEEAARVAKKYMDDHGLSQATFKCETKRGDKRFPKNSFVVSAEAGEYILYHVEGTSVDVHDPMFRVHIEIRENAAYVYADVIPGRGGMPIGSNGKATLLLSGGIDSPVAGYMIAKRGVRIEAVHYHSFPYTSERARDKVIQLAKIMSRYTGPIRLHIVSFTEIQMAIYEKCPEDELTVIMRCFMMKIAEAIAKKEGSQALVTGESLGQVASQTIESLHVTNSAVELPVFRPLIGMDKDEIIERAREIGTFETSIEPYEDCCTVFVPKHPVTKPRLDRILESEKLIDGDAMVARALESVETIVVRDED